MKKTFLLVKAAIFCGVFLMSTVGLADLLDREAQIPTTAKNSVFVAYGRVKEVQNQESRNQFGDKLIISKITFLVEEALKGTPANEVFVLVEGGEFNGVRMKVSDMPDVKTGDQLLIFAEPGEASLEYRPHRRGLGIFHMNKGTRRIQGGQLSLDDIRRLVSGS